MKKCLVRQLLMVLLLMSGYQPLSAQFTTIYEVTPVCNNDGVLVVQSPVPGVGIFYNWYTAGGLVTHFSMDMYDTLFNFSGGFVYLTMLPNNGMPNYFGSGYFDYPFQVIQTIVPDSCPQQNGSISLNVAGGVAPYTFAWTFNGLPFGGNTNALTGLSGGYYDCLISDMNGCQLMLNDLDSNLNGAFIPSINSIVLAVNSTPANCTNGTATVLASGGSAPYTYYWSNNQTTATATGLSALTVYTVSVTDADGCFQNSGAYITSTVTMNIQSSVTNANCDDSDGAITAIPTGGTGPYSYLWNTFATTSTLSNIPSGNYSVTVTDAQGCIQNGYFNVSSLTPVNVNYTVTPSQCTGATGTITPNVTGGTAPYTYEWLSNPVQTTPVASNLAPGNYNFIITDSQGCIRTGTVIIPQNTLMVMSMSGTPNLCISNNGTAAMNATGGVLPLSYLWSSSQTTAGISGMPSGNYFGTVTDADGCSLTDCILINQTSNLNIIAVPQIASCIYTADGAASVNIIAGAPPFQYSWSTGATTATISNLLPGIYWVVVTDANGCNDSQCFTIGYNSITPCSGTVQGSVFIDLNNNCVKDPLEPGMENIPVKCLTNGEIVFTDVNGYYEFVVQPGTITIQQLPVPYRYQVCPAGNPFTVLVPGAGFVVTQDIADTVDWVTDLSVKMYNYSSPPVVGTTFVQRIVEFNLGTIAVPSTSQYDYDSQAPFLVSNPGPSSLNLPLARATYDNPLSLPLRERFINVSHTIPVTVPINTILTYTDTIFPVSGDTTWWDNMDFMQLVTLGSYDPNYKEVDPAGVGAQGFISPADSVLQYVIHFQNLGNYYANEIIITDSLDSDLDWNSLRVEYASHEQTASISATGLLQFTFENIMLPAISQNELLSNGFVAYTIRLKPNLADGTQITNEADIYFDFNPAVRTNTTLNTIQITGIETVTSGNGITVYPNPNRGSCTLLFNDRVNGHHNIELFNVTGQSVYSKAHELNNAASIQIETGKLAPGIYTLRYTGNDFVKSLLMVIE